MKDEKDLINDCLQDSLVSLSKTMRLLQEVIDDEELEDDVKISNMLNILSSGHNDSVKKITMAIKML